MTLRIGVLGAGQVALDHVEVVEALGHRIVAGCTRSQSSANWAAFRERVPDARFVAPQAMLEDASLDAIVACLSWWVTPEWLDRLLRCPRPVLIEKPVALDRRTLARALALPGVRLDNKLVGFNRRYYRSVAALRDRIRDGGFVSATVAVSENLSSLARRRGPGVLAHVLATSSCHILDVALNLLGELELRSRFDSPAPGFEPFRNFDALLATAQGRPVNLSVHHDDPVVVGVTCRFDDRSIWQLGPMEILTVYRGYEVAEPTPEYRVRRYRPKVIDTVAASTEYRPGFYEQMDAFLSGDFGPGARVESSLGLLSLVESLEEIDGETVAERGPDPRAIQR